MPNTLLTIQMITRESLRVLENSLTFTKQITKEYDDRFAIAGAKIGYTLNIRKPPRYVGRLGAPLSIEDATETSVPLTLSQQRGVDIAFTTADLTMSVDDFSKRFLKPAIANVANKVDFDGCALINSIYNMVGVVGTAPNAALTYLLAGQRLNEEACPVDSRVVLMPPSFIPPIIDALKGLFQSSEKIAEQYEKGMMGTGLGFEKWLMDQNLPSHTWGALGAGATVTTLPLTGATSIVTGGWGNNSVVLKAGDVFVLQGIQAVNPQNLQPTGALREFVVAADVTSSGTGTATITFSPPLINPPSGFATVASLPAAGTPIQYAGTPTGGQVAPVAVAFHPEAFAMGCADLLLPGGVDMAARVSDNQLGLSIRAVRAYDINLDRMPTRLDILYGFATLYKEFACRIGG